MGEHVWIENERKADGILERRRYCIMAMKCDNEQSNSYRLKAVPKDDGKEHGWVGEHLLQLWPGEYGRDDDLAVGVSVQGEKLQGRKLEDLAWRDTLLLLKLIRDRLRRTEGSAVRH